MSSTNVQQKIHFTTMSGDNGWRLESTLWGLCDSTESDSVRTLTDFQQSPPGNDVDDNNSRLFRPSGHILQAVISWVHPWLWGILGKPVSECRHLVIQISTSLSLLAALIFILLSIRTSGILSFCNLCDAVVPCELPGRDYMAKGSGRV